MDGDTLAAMHELVRDHIKPETFDVTSETVLVTPESVTVHDLQDIIEKHRDRPKRPRGTSVHHTLESLTAHAKRHANLDDGEAVVFCDLVNAPSLTTVYNYLPPSTVDTAGEGAWRDHRAQYAFPLSDAWKRWTAIAGKALTVEQFSQLLEDGIADIRDPATATGAPMLEGVTYATPSELLTLSQGLQVRVSLEVIEQKRLDNGTGTLLFGEQHDARNAKGEAIRVPNGFLLGIPVFMGGDPYAVPARLRYRVQNKQVTWTVVLHDVETVKRTAVTEAAERFVMETSLPLFFGTAE